MIFNRNTLLILPMLVAAALPVAAQTLPYQNRQAPLETRVDDLMNRLTRDEKITLLAGTDFTTQPIPRLGIPPMAMADADQGVRGGSDSTLGPATAFPAEVTMASTWNVDLISRVGAAIGTEAQNKGTGVQVMLGPAVNIQRSPLGGRNGEYFSEDPFLAGRLGVAYIKGMQGVGTVACIKHFACNNEEADRSSVNVLVSERALREIYLPAFEAGVKDGHVWTIMTSYNMLNGYYTAANHYLLTDILKRGWGFDGAVMSDWGGAHSGVRVINAGNDLEMPGRGFLSPAKVNQALARGYTTQAQIDQNVRRIVRTILRSGVIDGIKTPDPALVNSAGSAVALQTAQEGIVLLKNERNILPLDASKIRSVAVIGPAAQSMQMGAGGSPAVTPLRSIGPLEGIQKQVGTGVEVRYVPADARGNLFPTGTVKTPDTGEDGFHVDYYGNKNLEGTPTKSRTDAQVNLEIGITGTGSDAYSGRWTGIFTPRKSGATKLLFRADDGCRLFLDDKLIIDAWRDSGAVVHVANVSLNAGQAYKLRAEYYQAGGNAAAQLRIIEPNTGPYADVLETARRSDVAIVCVSTNGTEGEGQDRPFMALPDDQDELVHQVAAANPRTVVVLNNGTPVSMPWLRAVPALVEAWYPGQEGGHALAQILFGEVNPSGHLPTTLGRKREDYPDYPNFAVDGRTVRYEEGIYVGYRAFDKRHIAPLFPFGYGLSYTTFRLSDLKLSSPMLAANGRLTASVRVTNTGKRAGAQVVQLYVRDPSPKADKPVRELKGFAKVFLNPGESQTAEISLTPRDFAWCDDKAKGWRANAGDYEIEIGDSSRHLTQRAKVQVAEYFDPIPLMRDETQPPAPETAPDLALGKKAFASSQQGDLKAEMAFDNRISTRWQANSRDNEWLAVDLGKPQKIGRVRLNWETAYAEAYRIEVSDDAQNWRAVYSTTESQGGLEDIAFTPTDARYVRVFAIKRGTEYGPSLLDFEVRAPK